MTLEEIFESRVGERLLSFVGLAFPFCQINSYFGVKVLCTTDNLALNGFFRVHLIGPLSELYGSTTNFFAIFIFMVVIFDVCVRKRLPLTLFTRFNIIQGILLEVIATFLSQVYSQLSYTIRESTWGELYCNASYFGIMLVILYCAVMISFGRYSKIPVISTGARLNVQRFR